MLVIRDARLMGRPFLVVASPIAFRALVRSISRQLQPTMCIVYYLKQITSLTKSGNNLGMIKWGGGRAATFCWGEVVASKIHSFPKFPN